MSIDNQKLLQKRMSEVKAFTQKLLTHQETRKIFERVGISGDFTDAEEKIIFE